MTRGALTILLFAPLLMGGCGTFSDIMAGPANGQVYYRGVTMDVEGIKKGGAMTLLVLDLPFSALADTAMFPVQAYYQLTEQPTGSLTTSADRSLPTQTDEHSKSSEQHRRLWLEEQREAGRQEAN
jgi:uncharacterized protein YceK